ncbi:uncharacterized [Tachysurus ichikawai]
MGKNHGVGGRASVLAGSECHLFHSDIEKGKREAMDKGVLFSQAPLAGLLFLPLSCEEGLIREGKSGLRRITKPLLSFPGCLAAL